MKNKRKISLLLAVLMIVGIVFTFAWADTPTKFKDVKKSDWFYDAVQYCVEQGLVYGRTDDTFVPQGNVTRAEFITILARVHGFDKSQHTKGNFADVKSSDWFFAAVNWAYDFGITNGISSKNFAPNDPVTREQIACFIHRYIKLIHAEDAFQPDIKDAWQFVDMANVSSWAKASVQAMHTYGLMEGCPDGVFKPKNNMTRAEAATVLCRLHKALEAASAATPATDHVHDWSEWEVVTAATCTSDGVERHTCNKCGEVEERVISKTGHKWSDWDVGEATCEADGVKSRACENCGKVETVTIPATGHDWDDGVVTKQYTCTEDGEITYTCKNNPEHVRTEVVPAHHVFGESVVVKEPTCEESGLEEGVCTVCGEKRTNEIPALGHKLGLVKGTEPTCENGGIKDVWHCSVCEKNFLDSAGTISVDDSNAKIAPLDHNWEEVYESKSYPLYKMEQHEFCDICHRDLTEIDYTEAYGHLAAHDSEDPNYMKTHMEYVATENGSLETKQLVGYKCERCGDTKDAEATEHVHDYQPIMFTVELPAFKFVKLHRCSACGMDCTNMTEEEWQEHFDSHMLKTDGEFAIRYDSAESVQDGTRKFDVQIGWKCADNDSEVYFTMFAPQYDFSKSIDKTAVLDGNICNADGCNAIYSCGGYVKGFVAFEDLGTFVTSKEARSEHTHFHLIAHEASGCHSFSNLEAVISYTHHRDFVGFVQL